MHNILEIVNKLLNNLSKEYNERALEIIKERYGLNERAEIKTLEEVGQIQGGLTRERIR